MYTGLGFKLYTACSIGWVSGEIGSSKRNWCWVDFYIIWLEDRNILNTCWGNGAVESVVMNHVSFRSRTAGLMLDKRAEEVAGWDFSGLYFEIWVHSSRNGGSQTNGDSKERKRKCVVRICGVEENKHARKHLRRRKSMEFYVRRVCLHRSRAVLLVCEK